MLWFCEDSIICVCKSESRMLVDRERLCGCVHRGLAESAAMSADPCSCVRRADLVVLSEDLNKDKWFLKYRGSIVF